MEEEREQHPPQSSSSAAGSALPTRTMQLARLEETTWVLPWFDSEPPLLCTNFWKDDELPAALLCSQTTATLSTRSSRGARLAVPRHTPVGMSYIRAHSNPSFATLAEAD